jgi:hypothetical protein
MIYILLRYARDFEIRKVSDGMTGGLDLGCKRLSTDCSTNLLYIVADLFQI